MERALSDAQIREIRNRYNATRKLSTNNPKRVTIVQLAREYNSSRTSVWKIVNEYSYQDVENDY